MTRIPRAKGYTSAARTLFNFKPYGDSLLTPAVATWIRSAWIVVFLMATLEGVVWGLVGATMVPRDATWLAPVSGVFMFALMFSIVWIVDASLIMSERPMIRRRRWNPGFNHGLGALLRWTLGLGVRVAIVAISLYVTAPFLAKLIRADDIAAYHQQQVEQYFTQREEQLQGQIKDQTRQLEKSFQQRTEPLRAEINRATVSLSRERQRRAEIEAEYAPELNMLRNDATAARERVGNEILGRDGRPAGRGPEARKWESNAASLEAQLKAKQEELDQRIADSSRRINELEETLRSRSEQLRELGRNHQERIDQAITNLKEQQVGPAAPKLSFAARSKALEALRSSPEERGVPHFETVEGFSQAALGVLFFSLIALKLFEPGAVRAYFSETAQAQYKKYLEGGLNDIPGFEIASDQAQRLNAVEFMRLWTAYERDPASFFADRKALVEVQEPLTQFLAERDIEGAKLNHRRQHLEEEMVFARRRREQELLAFEHELKLRTAHLQTQLANETRTLTQQRRAALAAELRQARAEWQERKAREEEELKLLKASFEEEQRQGREDLQLRTQELDLLKESTIDSARRDELSKQHAHAQKLAEIDSKHQRELYKTRLTGIRTEIARLRSMETKQRAERQTQLEANRRIRESLEAVRQKESNLLEDLTKQRNELKRLAKLMAAQSAGGSEQDNEKPSFWSRAMKAAGAKTLRDIEREFKNLEKSERVETERLSKLREERTALELRKDLSANELAEVENRLTTTETQIRLYEESLHALFDSDGNDQTPPSQAPEVETDDRVPEEGVG